MKGRFVLSALLALTAASPAPNPSVPPSSFCKTWTVLSTEACATPFCSQYLHISTSTATSYTTVQQSSVTRTSTVTSTATVSSTTTPTITSMATVTTTTTTYYCAASAAHKRDELVPPMVTAKLAGTAVLERRGNPTTTTTPCTATPTCFNGQPSDKISSACSCMALSTPTTTTTISSTGAASTTTVTTTTTQTASTVITAAPVTTTSTTTTTVTTTVRLGQAAVQLSHPTPITPISGGKAPQDYDDQTGWRIDSIPFDVGLFGVTGRSLIVGINGWVSPGTTDSRNYVNQPLPSNLIGYPAWVPYWSDLFIQGGTTQGIYYEIDGDPGQRTLSIEYFTSFYQRTDLYTHFMLTLFENEIGRVVFSYFQTTGERATTDPSLGTIGVQDGGPNSANQYSFNVQPREGLVIEWRPSTNQWREITAGSC